MPGAVVPGSNDAAATHNLPQRTFRLNLRPARARRLSEVGRHWAPIARQRATRKARHSGLAWPAYCNKPKGAPPVMDGMGRTVAHGGQRCPPKKEYLGMRFFGCPATGGACVSAWMSLTGQLHSYCIALDGGHGWVLVGRLRSWCARCGHTCTCDAVVRAGHQSYGALTPGLPSLRFRIYR